MMDITQIKGAVPSKSNSYKLTSRGGFASMYKSKALKEYEKSFFLQCPATWRNRNLDKLMRIELHIYYTSNRLDLDNSAKILLDCLESAKVIKNDNLVAELYMTKHIDKENPRVEILIKELL